MKPPPGIADWTTARFRRWAGGRIEGHTDQLGRLLKIVSGQNEIISAAPPSAGDPHPKSRPAHPTRLD